MLKLTKKNSIGKVFSGNYLYPSREENFLLETMPSFCASLLHKRGKALSNVSEWIGFHDERDWQHPVGVFWLGHATCLIRINDIVIITDPVFDSLPFFSRQLPFGISVDILPNIDAILLSHNHHDHMHMPSLYTIQHRSPSMHIAAAQGDQKWFSNKIFNSVEQYMWGQQFVVEKNKIKVRCTFVPSYHWSRRSLFDRNVSLWGSWIIEYDDGVIYFGGDTAYNNHFSEIASLYDIDVALLPIGPAEPHEHMKHSHLSPEQAGQAFLDLRAKRFIPIHWGTFGFGADVFDDPVIRLNNWWKKNTPQLRDKKLFALKVGQQLVL